MGRVSDRLSSTSIARGPMLTLLPYSVAQSFLRRFEQSGRSCTRWTPPFVRAQPYQSCREVILARNDGRRLPPSAASAADQHRATGSYREVKKAKKSTKTAQKFVAVFGLSTLVRGHSIHPLSLSRPMARTPISAIIFTVMSTRA